MKKKVAGAPTSGITDSLAGDLWDRRLRYLTTRISFLLTNSSTP